MSISVITVSVNYADILSITLPRMLEHFSRVTVITDLQDSETWSLARPKVSVLRTDAFYSKGAIFNKGLALDSALQNAIGWVCLIDADIYLPESLPLPELQVGKLYSPYRRILSQPSLIPEDWSRLPEGWERRNKEFAGYFQLFNTLDTSFGPYACQWTTAQGCDSVFFKRWDESNRVRLEQFEVLHLGPLKENWKGRRSQRWNQ